ncbi:MAG: PVC-type heme-binding CxxCH protein [Chitinophagaceae bacterium]
MKLRNNSKIVGAVAFAMLVFTCIVPRNSVQDEPQQPPAFNPNPSPAYLSPAQSAKTMYLPKGYRLELVAAEPMIKEPVAITWDGNARMYVAEMITYMQDADATGERQPKSRISLLEDTDNDGRMDKSTVFIDSLLLPRMLICVNNELLVNETNTINLYSYKDTNGDGKADVKKPVYKNDRYTTNDANMEHQRSGLDWNLDNWMYITYDPVRFRYNNGMIRVDTMPSGSGGGQWGVTHDNYGRLFYSSAGGENPVLGFQINPAYGNLNFPDQFDADFQEVWPVIATPDVQGGEKRLRPNVTLNHFTASCGQSIYRGDRLPEDLVGNYIVCEPVARIIRRAKVSTIKGKTTVENFYDKHEFIASSDMNFRPVNSATGPDGNLYIVDMHRGIIQQANWTKPGTFLRNKIDSLGLAKNTGHGRIYRVVYDGYKRGAKPAMLNEPAGKLVTYLNHPNGWWRDNAQKQIITSGDRSVIPALRAMATGQQPSWKGEAAHLARIHALWTLEGLNAIDEDILLSAFKDDHAQVRKAAIRISEPYLKSDGMMEKLQTLANDSSYDVRVQLLLSLYNARSGKAKEVMNQILNNEPDNQMLSTTKAALDRNENVRTFGARLGNMAAADRNLILNGAATFKSLCASCHGVDGKGMSIGGAGLAAPPLAGSKRLTLPEKNSAIRILLHGLTGPIDGKTYPSIMPPMEANSDEWIAAVASYVRYTFSAPTRAQARLSPVVKPEEVKKIRLENAGKTTAWTLSELAARSNEDSIAQATPVPAATPSRQ